MQLNRNVIVALVVMGLGMTGCGGGNAKVSGPASALDPTIRASLQETLRAHPAPSISAARVTESKIQIEAAGVRKMGETTLATANDRYCIGSCAKAMTSTLVAILVEQGKMRWDMTLEEVFPEYAATMCTDLKSVSLQQLLQLRGGMVTLLDFADLQTVPQFSGSKPAQRRAFLQWVTQQSANSKPGEYAYSNSCYVVVAAMIDKVTGKDWESEMKAKIYDPLGMTSVSAGWPAMGRAPQPWGHIPNGNGTFTPHDPDNAVERLPDYMAATGGLAMTVTDYAKFVQMNLRGLRGQDTLIKAATVKKLFTPPTGGDYAFGWGIETNGDPYYLGDIGTFIALVRFSVGQNKAEVALVNAGLDEYALAAAEDAVTRLKG